MIRNLVWLALNIFFEARGECFEGKVAVGHVTMNRIVTRDLSLEDIIKQPWQFSWMNADQRKKLKIVFQDFESLIECAEAAMKTLEERLEGKDLWGATHYYSDSLPEPPYWADDYPFIVKKGRHNFHK
jgi:N-acetylmuramoyl-L-alanine amidase